MDNFEKLRRIFDSGDRYYELIIGILVRSIQSNLAIFLAAILGKRVLMRLDHLDCAFCRGYPADVLFGLLRGFWGHSEVPEKDRRADPFRPHRYQLTINLNKP